MTHRCLFTVLWIASLLAQSGEPTTQTVRDFYHEYQKLHITGLPDKAAVQKLSPYLSRELAGAITRAQMRQARCIALHPGDKGPWVEGDMFSNNFEGFTNVRVDEAKPGKSPRQLLPLRFEFMDSGKTITWTDQAVVIKKGNQWMIDNILYVRKKGFGNGFGGSLRQSFKAKGC